VSTGVMFCLGRVSALTMLYNLNYRCSLRQASADTDNVQTANITNKIREWVSSMIHTLISLRKPSILRCASRSYCSFWLAGKALIQAALLSSAHLAICVDHQQFDRFLGSITRSPGLRFDAGKTRSMNFKYLENICTAKCILL
jgi:hypothetical protein